MGEAVTYTRTYRLVNTCPVCCSNGVLLQPPRQAAITGCNRRRLDPLQHFVRSKSHHDNIQEALVSCRIHAPDLQFSVLRWTDWSAAVGRSHPAAGTAGAANACQQGFCNFFQAVDKDPSCSKPKIGLRKVRHIFIWMSFASRRRLLSVVLLCW